MSERELWSCGPVGSETVGRADRECMTTLTLAREEKEVRWSSEDFYVIENQNRNQNRLLQKIHHLLSFLLR